VEGFTRLVVPLVAAPLRPAARRLLDRVGQRSPRVCLVHGDLGPQHVRVRGGQVTGVIDWGDAVIGDPALDLAWPLHGTSAEFADAVAASYGLDAATAARALDWHLLGPWHEVTYGLDTDQPAFVRSGLAGVEQRLAVAE
jgi:aminoglycoside phosphotransferase (APT) family kinase protein